MEAGNKRFGVKQINVKCGKPKENEGDKEWG